MSPSTRVGARIMERAVSLMRAAPGLFATGWLAAAAVWLLQGRLERALAAVLVATIAGLGMRIALASRG